MEKFNNEGKMQDKQDGKKVQDEKRPRPDSSLAILIASCSDFSLVQASGVEVSMKKEGAWLPEILWESTLHNLSLLI